jgi:hypothetical protein
MTTQGALSVYTAVGKPFCISFDGRGRAGAELDPRIAVVVERICHRPCALLDAESSAASRGVLLRRGQIPSPAYARPGSLSCARTKRGREPLRIRGLGWSGRLDLNQRPLAPQRRQASKHPPLC